MRSVCLVFIRYKALKNHTETRSNKRNFALPLKNARNRTEINLLFLSKEIKTFEEKRCMYNQNKCNAMLGKAKEEENNGN